MLNWRNAAFVLFMLGLMGLFLLLGTWQVQRLAEKEQLIANVAARMDLPPLDLPATAEWPSIDWETYDFRPLTLSGTYRPDRTVLVFTSLGDAKGPQSGPGFWVMTPLALTGGGTVFINRGFVPQASSASYAMGADLPPTPVSLTGIARTSEAVGSFTPQPDTQKRVEWVRNVVRLGAMAGVDLGPYAPVYLDLPADPAQPLPQGGETVLEFPNSHLGYAMTWYGFALLVPFLLGFWLLRQRRPPPQP